ncbi:hypothetical protein LU276_03985 [Moraxella haemolytica]|uniref:hypothetical protein n=1 Tax=Moraxella haemolytica TaxID=2904119 RepID=UPI002543B421|nr:hypothetical protein [Moraxella sp. ZY171148]WII95982.1 hypothetical protein LU276_03985 [Moraxella sp. ZY171148]
MTQYYALDLSQEQAVIAKGDGVDLSKFFIYDKDKKEWVNNFYWGHRVLYDDFTDYQEITQDEAQKLINQA